MKKSVFVVGTAALCLSIAPMGRAMAADAPAVPPVPMATAPTTAAPKVAPTQAENYHAALQRVGELAQAEKWDEARAELKRAEGFASTLDERAFVSRQIGQTYASQGQPEKAWQIWREILAMPELSQSQNIVLRTVLATSLAQAKKWQDARREAQRSVKEAPADTPAEVLFTAQSIIGDSFLETGKYVEARRAYDRALNLASGQSVFLIFQSSVGINIAKSYLRDKQPMNARIYLRTALSALPLAGQQQGAAPLVAFLQTVGQQMIAESYRDEGDKVNAIIAYRALSADPNAPEPVKAEAAKQLQALQKAR